MSSGIYEKEMQRQSKRQLRQTEFSLCIAKFSQGLRNFCNHSENFAILAKFRYSQFFAIIAKITVHSENLNFRYALHFLYDSEIHYA